MLLAKRKENQNGVGAYLVGTTSPPSTTNSHDVILIGHAMWPNVSRTSVSHEEYGVCESLCRRSERCRRARRRGEAPATGDVDAFSWSILRYRSQRWLGRVVASVQFNRFGFGSPRTLELLARARKKTQSLECATMRETVQRLHANRKGLRLNWNALLECLIFIIFSLISLRLFSSHSLSFTVRALFYLKTKQKSKNSVLGSFSTAAPIIGHQKILSGARCAT